VSVNKQEIPAGACAPAPSAGVEVDTRSSVRSSAGTGNGGRLIGGGRAKPALDLAAAGTPHVRAHRDAAMAALGYSAADVVEAMASHRSRWCELKRRLVVWMLTTAMGEGGKYGRPSQGEVAEALGLHRTTVLYHAQAGEAMQCRGSAPGTPAGEKA